MFNVLEVLGNHPIRQYAAGEFIIGQGQHTGFLYVLIEGAVEVVKDDVVVAKASEPGAVFGDLSVLLGIPHTAGVRALAPSRFYVIEDAPALLKENPAFSLHLCELLARRLDAVNKYLVDVKHQFAGDDHLAMVDEVLDTLMHRQPRKRVAPPDSTLRDPEIAD